MAATFLKRNLLCCVSVLALVACGTLPASGPYSHNIRGGATYTASIPAQQGAFNTYENLQYALLDINQPLVPLLKEEQKKYPLYEESPLWENGSTFEEL
ncbi:MAG: hypothetical protein AAFY76_25300, partial [Cyanobacteria bacterium J06649_11]